MWTRFFSTAAIPVSLLLFLNARIVIDLCGSRKVKPFLHGLCFNDKSTFVMNDQVQRFGSARRQRKEFNLSLILLCIVLVFFLCHAARIILDVYEFANLEKVLLTAACCYGYGTYMGYN